MKYSIEKTVFEINPEIKFGILKLIVSI